MRLVHEPAGDVDDGSSRTLATRVERAETFLARMRGLMFRRSIPDDYALVFHFGDPATRSLHMLFVPFAIDALWLVDGEVQAVDTLPAWRGFEWGRADTVVELPADRAVGVEPGDEVRLVRSG